MSLKITKNKIDEHDGGLQCEMCGFPMDMDEDDPACFEIENLEHLAFCSRRCAIDFLHNAEYDMSDSAEGGYVIA